MRIKFQKDWSIDYCEITTNLKRTILRITCFDTVEDGVNKILANRDLILSLNVYCIININTKLLLALIDNILINIILKILNYLLIFYLTIFFLIFK